MAAYVKLDEIIKSLLIQMGEQTEHKYMQMLDIGIRGVKELAFDVTQSVKAVSLPINDNLTVDLPCDFVNYRRIGVCINGGLESLGLDTEMCIAPNYDGCGDPIAVATTSNNIESIESVSWITDYRGGENIGGAYGIGGGNNSRGYYRINKETNQIVLSSDFSGDSIVLEYISDGSGDTGTFEIHVFAEEAVRAYMWWKHLQRKKYVSGQEKELARRDFYNEKRIATARFSSFNKEEALQASRKNNKQSPKS